MTTLRRDPAAVFAAHAMDPGRCELYVEGPKDRRFLTWLVGSARHRDSMIQEIDAVDLPTVALGGRRTRVLAFADLADGAGVATIRCFVDADFDRILGSELTGNVWLTDGRDLEGYVLCAECIDKAWRLGAGADDVDPQAILAEVFRVAGNIADLRYASHHDGLDLPFRATRIRRHVTVADRDLTFEATSFARSLFQNAGRPISGVEAFLDHASDLAVAADHNQRQHVHGKDAFDLLAELLHAEGVSRVDAPKILWTAFERSLCVDHDNLTRVVRYLETCDGA